MRIAIPHWQGRVSPVFDVAGNLLFIDVTDGKEQARQNVAVDAEQPQARANLLVQHGATVLICGAISWPLERIIAASGIEVIPQVCGDIERVLAAFISGQLNQDVFLMPGCRRRRWRLQTGHRRGERCWRHGQRGGEDNAQR